MRIIEIEGDSTQPELIAQTGCPESGQTFKSIFCRFRDRCELPQISVAAQTAEDASDFLDYAARMSNIPKCLANKTFLTRINGRWIPFH